MVQLFHSKERQSCLQERWSSLNPGLELDGAAPVRAPKENLSNPWPRRDFCLSMIKESIMHVESESTTSIEDYSYTHLPN